MKDSFKEYYSLDASEKGKLWKEAVFVFDANVLLNLYRYSEKTRKDFLKALEKLNGRIWLPHQFALEYQRNRLEVIEDQFLSYTDVSTTLQGGFDSISKEIQKYEHRHPFLKIEKLLTRISKSISSAQKEVELAKDKHPNWFEKDPIREQLDELFKGKVGAPCDDIEKVEREGSERYAKDIPPGYADSKKDRPGSLTTRRYGDWIGWYQIIEMARETKKPVILVINDKKEDWWLIVRKKIVGPRPELIKEMAQCEVMFHMYTMENFLKYAEVKKATAQEIEEVNKKVTEDLSNAASDATPPNGGVEVGSPNDLASDAGEQAGDSEAGQNG